MPQAAVLQSVSISSANTDQAAGFAARVPRVAWPESAASSGERPVSSAYAAMQPPTATAHSTVRRAVCRIVGGGTARPGSPTGNALTRWPSS